MRLVARKTASTIVHGKTAHDAGWLGGRPTARQERARVRAVRRLCVLSIAVAISGCTCGKKEPAPTDAGAPAASASAAPTFELELKRTTLIAFGNSTPLPVAEDFQEEVPALRPPLERAAAQKPNAPLRMRVARDVPYGQLTRLMQAALGFRVPSWDLWVEDTSGTLQSVHVLPPGPTPRGNCWARAWVGPDARVQLGIDVGADAGAMHGVLVQPKDGVVNGALATEVLRRMDAHCKEGQVRLYSQAPARVGPVFDLARAIAAASPAPHLAEQLFAVPSIGPLDSADELAK